MNILTILTLIFLVLKLTGHIDWSWWLVFLPSTIFGVFWLVAVILEANLTPEQRIKRDLRKKYGIKL